MKKTILPLIIASLLIFTLYNSASAAITVVGKRGQAAYSVGRQWLPVNVGMNLPVGARVSTGVNSEVRLNINGNSVTLLALTMVKIYTTKVERMTSTTEIGLRRGAIDAEVNKDKKVRSVFRVATPVATSSVRGTRQRISHGPMKGTRIYVPHGVVQGKDRGGSNKLVKGLLVFWQKPNKPGAEPLLGELIEKAIAAIHFKNESGDESISRQFFLGDMPDFPYDQIKDMEGGTSANARIYIIWP